jgi:FRG domain
METIGKQKIWSFVEKGTKAAPTTCTNVRQGNAQHVTSFLDLARKVAELQFMNRDFVLFFRGQSSDWRNKKNNTSLKPTILRERDPKQVPTDKALSLRYAQLDEAEKQLVGHYRTGTTPGTTRLRRQQILRWSILQHYEVCKSPLLDVTHSLRIAASFASANANDRHSFSFWAFQILAVLSQRVLRQVCKSFAFRAFARLRL